MTTQNKPRFFEQGGGRFFVSVTSGRIIDCVLLKAWDDVIDYLRSFNTKIPHGSHFELIEIFTRPRLCRDCLNNHATQPEMFDVTTAVPQCLCWVEENPGCSVHKFG